MTEPKKTGPAQGFHRPALFPDDATCRVKQSEIPGWLICKSMWAAFCPHALTVSHTYYCRHPTAAEMLRQAK